MTRVALFSDQHAFARALKEALAERHPVTALPLDPAAAEPPDRPNLESLPRDLVICPGVPFSPENRPRVDRLVRRLASLDETASVDETARHVVLLSSSAVYEPRPGHPGFVAERPAEKLRAKNQTAREWIEMEREVKATLAGKKHRLTILRPAPVLIAGADDLFSRLLATGSESSLAMALPGHDPSLQLLDVADLAASISLALDASSGGLFHLAPRSVVPLRFALRRLGRRVAPIPRFLRVLARRLGKSRSRGDIDYLRYQFNVSPERAHRELGWTAANTSLEVVEAHGHEGHAGEPPAGGVREPELDPYGLDLERLDQWSRRVWRLAHDRWWRIEVQGVDNVPREGAAVLSGIHRGYMPMDAIMLLHLLRTRIDRTPRFLIHPSLLKLPFLFDFLRRIGGVIACQPIADDLLGRGSIVGVLPEGAGGAFAEYRNAYRIGSFGRSDFVRLAIRHSAPIVPFATIGPAESMPIYRLWKWSWWRKTMGWPGFPISPTFPLWPPGLPAKWHTWILPPIDVAARFPPSAARDREAVRELSDEFRKQIGSALDRMLMRRRSIWRGNIFDQPNEPGPGS